MTPREANSLGDLFYANDMKGENTMIDFIVNNWYYITLIAVFIGGGISAVVKFMRLSREEQIKKLKGWLLQAVIKQEREFSSGTGKLKLSAAYDDFCEKMPWLAKVITYEDFKGYVDEALTEMKEIIANNQSIASIVENTRI